MSYWVYLEDEDGKCVEVEPHQEGGTYCVGGVPHAELNVTYNYDFRCLDPELGLRWLDGKRAGDGSVKLALVAMVYGDYPSDNYWDNTPGNVGHVIAILLKWAFAHPDATWRVS